MTRKEQIQFIQNEFNENMGKLYECYKQLDEMMDRFDENSEMGNYLFILKKETDNTHKDLLNIRDQFTELL